jgi:hypothetical protein
VNILLILIDLTFLCIVSHSSVSYHIYLYRITFLCIVSHLSVSYHIPLYRITFICIVSHSSVSYHIPLYRITFLCILSLSSVSYHIPLYRITFLCIVSLTTHHISLILILRYIPETLAARGKVKLSAKQLGGTDYTIKYRTVVLFVHYSRMYRTLVYCCR